ncbi:MAG: hypothetical protein LBV79_06015 [Candidatus Adiutrix sp.]|nr:hypothetical protein [Candidatus Adiutrix sp.]
MRSNFNTTQGLAWDQIAKERLGTEFRMHELLSANWKSRGVLLFSGDISVAVPEVASQATKSPAESLPPWKR